MPPARGDYEARFRHDPNKPVHLNYHRKRVEAFNDDGQALVVDDYGNLTPARAYSNFIDVIATSHVIGVIPGGGWTIEWTSPESGDVVVDAVVAWTVNSAGYATPLVVDDPQTPVAEPSDDLENARLVAPGSAA